MIDALESRKLLTASLNNGVLTLTSIYFPDQYTVTADGTNYTVDILNEGFHAQYPETGSSRLTGLVINSNTGGTAATRPGDTITISAAVSLPTTVNGSVGPDTIQAGSGDTSVSGTVGADSIVGGSGNDTLHGGDGFAAANGNPAADDTIFGGAGDDQLFGDGSPNPATLGSILIGGAGNDTLQGGDGRDIMDGGSGTNTLDYTDKTGLGVNVVFPNPPIPGITGTITPTNFPFQGDGLVVQNNGAYVENEHDQLYAGLDALPNASITYDNITSHEVALISDSTFSVINTGAGTDLVDVSGTSGVAYNINTGDGVDELLGGPLNDTLTAGDGRSTGAGAGRNGTQDQVFGQAGNDSITGGVDGDLLYGEVGNDTIVGLGGGDTMQGGDGADSLDGGVGNDLMIGGDGIESDPDGNDTMLGGPGGSSDADTLQGDGGIDTADYHTRTTNLHIGLDLVHDDGDYNTTTGTSIEHDFVTETTEIVLSGSGNDTLTGSQYSSTLMGNAGNDSLFPGTGSTTFSGGTGKDTLSYAARTSGVNISLDGAANDGAGSDNVGNDIEVLIGGSGADNINGDNVSLALTIQGNAGNDTLVGGALADTLVGGAGNDNLNGAAGNDTLDGGAGGDILDGGDGADLVDYSTRTAAITVTMDGVANDGTSGEGDNVLGTVEQVNGGSGNDSISADANNATNYRFMGNGGNDTLVGGAGNDYLDAGAGNDSIVGNGGNNVEYGQAGNDSIVGGAGNDRLLGGPGTDSLTGAAGDDTLLAGGGSKDTLRGGDGSDTVSYYYETRSVHLSLDGLSNDGVGGSKDFIAADVENLQGGNFKDTIVGNSGDNNLDGGGGNDSITGGGGNDSLTGDAGSDTLDGGAGNDTLDGGVGGDALIGGDGTDTADYSNRTVAVFVSIDDRVNDGAAGEFDNVSSTVEIILGGSGNDSLSTGAHSMTLNGNAGNDTLVGGRGNDCLIGGAGLDSLVGGAGDDTILAQDGQADTLDGGTGNNDLVYDNGIDVL